MHPRGVNICKEKDTIFQSVVAINVSEDLLCHKLRISQLLHKYILASRKYKKKHKYFSHTYITPLWSFFELTMQLGVQMLLPSGDIMLCNKFSFLCNRIIVWGPSAVIDKTAVNSQPILINISDVKLKSKQSHLLIC